MATATAIVAESTTAPKRVEKWEIEKIGGFLLEVYHRQVFSARSDWLVLKQRLRAEFQKFLSTPENQGLREKFEENGRTNIGTLLQRTNFLTHTPRDSDHYCIRSLAFFQFRNQKIQEFDNQRKNGGAQPHGLQGMDAVSAIDTATAAAAAAANTNSGDGLEDVDPALAVLLQVDASSQSHTLEYQATERQARKSDFLLTSMGCYICQTNFVTADAFETHVEYHGDDSDFESLQALEKSDSPWFKLSYKLCKNSHYFCFTLETAAAAIIIDKIIIVQSRSMYYVHNTRVPYELPASGRQNFFVDSHLFRIYEEQPIVVVCHERGNEETRIMEQHHFMRVDAFPVVSFGISPNRLPNKQLFKQKFVLPQYLPTKEMRLALNQEFPTAHLMEISNDFGDYMRKDKVLTQQNLRQAMNVLLQVEDMDGIREYSSLIQRNAKLRKYDNEYSLKLKHKNDKRVFIENVLSPYDEVVIIPENVTSAPLKADLTMDLLLKNSDDFGTNNRKKTYFGQVERISNGRVTFVSDVKIPIEKKFLLIFRPMRLVLRYQYRALELYDQMSGTDKKRFLFPEAVLPLTLPTTNLNLHNTTIMTNPEQLEAVRNIAEGPRKEATYIIFGPPGTGKTTTLVEAIYQLYLRRSDTKIIITAGSNSACDEIALRLCHVLSRFDDPRALVRIYARSNEKRSDNIDELLLESSNMYSAQFYPAIELLHEYRIVVCTLCVIGKLATGKFGKNEQGKGIYTHVFVDEVAASTECEVLVGIMGTLTSQASLILAGDHKQLGPILQSKRAEDLGLAVSLMERLLTRDCYRTDEAGNYDRSIQTRLCRNYRSHPEIVNLYSEMYYDGELRALASSDVTMLSQKWHYSPNPKYPIIFHSVFGKSERDHNSVSLYNPKELEVVMDYVKDLMYYGVNGQKITQNDIGIISPYKKQYLRIQDELNLRHWYRIETGSVETFQGKEKTIIIVSFVRSFTPTLGFLENPRRLNVTLSRPKSLLILIGNPKTLSLNDDFKRIILKCSKKKTLVGTFYHELYENVATPLSPKTKVQNLNKSMEKLNLDKNNTAAASSSSAAKTASNPIEIGEKKVQPQKTLIFEKKTKKCKKKKNKKNAVNAEANTKNNNNNNSEDSSSSSDVKPKTAAQKKNAIVPTPQTLQQKQLNALFDELPNVPHKTPKEHVAQKPTESEVTSVEDLREKLEEQMRKFKLSLPAMEEASTSSSANIKTAATAAKAQPTTADINTNNNKATTATTASSPPATASATNAKASTNTKVYVKKSKDANNTNLAHFIGQNVVFIPESIYKEPQSEVLNSLPQLKKQKVNSQQPNVNSAQTSAPTAVATNANSPQNTKAHPNQQHQQNVMFVPLHPGMPPYLYGPQQNINMPQHGMYLPQNMRPPNQNVNLMPQNMLGATTQNMNFPRHFVPLPQYNVLTPQQQHQQQQQQQQQQQHMRFAHQNIYAPQQNINSPQQSKNAAQPNMQTLQRGMNPPQQIEKVQSTQQSGKDTKSNPAVSAEPTKLNSPPVAATDTAANANAACEAKKPPTYPTLNLKWERNDSSSQSTTNSPQSKTNSPTESLQYAAHPSRHLKWPRSDNSSQLNKLNSPTEIDAPTALHLKWQRSDATENLATIAGAACETKKPPTYPTLNLKWERNDSSSQSTTNSPQSETNSPTESLQYAAHPSRHLKWQRSSEYPSQTLTSSASSKPNAMANLKSQQPNTIAPLIYVTKLRASPQNTTRENSPQSGTSSTQGIPATPAGPYYTLRTGVNTAQLANANSKPRSENPTQQSSKYTTQPSGISAQQLRRGEGGGATTPPTSLPVEYELHNARVAEDERLRKKKSKSSCIIA